MVGGSIHEIKIEGRSAGEFSIETPPDLNIATATLNDSTLKIRTIAEGETSVIIKEANGNKTIEIRIEVRMVYLSNKNLNLKRGETTTVTMSGKNIGFPLEVQPLSHAVPVTATIVNNGRAINISVMNYDIGGRIARFMVRERNAGATASITVEIIE